MTSGVNPALHNKKLATTTRRRMRMLAWGARGGFKRTMALAAVVSALLVGIAILRRQSNVHRKSERMSLERDRQLDTIITLVERGLFDQRKLSTPSEHLESAMKLLASHAGDGDTSSYSTSNLLHSGAYISSVMAMPSLQCSAQIGPESNPVQWHLFFHPSLSKKEVARQTASVMSYKDKKAFFDLWRADSSKKVDKSMHPSGRMASFPFEYALNEALIPGNYQTSPSSTASRVSNVVFATDGLARIKARSSLVSCGIIEREIPHRYCDTRNISLRLSMLPAASSGSELPLSFGGLLATCSLNETSWFAGGFGVGAQGWMYNGMDFLQPKNDIQCDGWIETPVFFISRWDTMNPYQFHQDALNTFIVYTLLGLTPNEMQVVLLDRRDRDGPFTLTWSHLFSGSHRLMDLDQVVRAAGSAKQNPTLCFQRAVWGIHGGISPLAMDAHHSMAEKVGKVHSSRLLEAFRAFMLEGIRDSVMGTQDDTVPLPMPSRHLVPIEKEIWDLMEEGRKSGTIDSDLIATTQRRVIVITYAVRGLYSSGQIPESGVLVPQSQGVRDGDVRPAVQEGKYRAHKVLRTVSNDAKVMEGIRHAARTWESHDKRGIKAQFRVVDFATLSFVDQVAVSSSTDFFIGTHGAHFAHLIYLRRQPRAGVLELQPPERSMGNYQFENLSLRLGHIYESVRYGWKDVTPEGKILGPSHRAVSGDEMEAIQVAVTQILSKLAEGR
ncbi:hypothetical protein BC830DRAFT_1169098 [Chytriomyces sp. MP71]|nr:hypothetical protein BC830DRAFT_1169098 [Chytriomyces sp. MP71]